MAVAPSRAPGGLHTDPRPTAQRGAEGIPGERLCASDAALADARRFTQELAKTVRNLEGEKLDEWLSEADASEAEVLSILCIYQRVCMSLTISAYF